MGELEAKIAEPIPGVLNYVLLPFQWMWSWAIKPDCFAIRNNRSTVQTGREISWYCRAPGNRCGAYVFCCFLVNDLKGGNRRTEKTEVQTAQLNK